MSRQVTAYSKPSCGQYTATYWALERRGVGYKSDR